MNEWWSSLELFDKIIWGITLPISAIFLLQTIMTFMGMDSDAGIDADFSGDINTELETDPAPFQLFTFRNFTNFLLGFGWTIISFRGIIDNKIWLGLLGSAIGLGLVALLLYIMKAMMGLAENNNLRIQNALDKTGTVYLSIPAHKSGFGKLQINIQGSLRELNALTEGEAIPTGALVKVKSVISDKTLLVERI